jgi:hypothetical protein
VDRPVLSARPLYAPGQERGGSAAVSHAQFVPLPADPSCSTTKLMCADVRARLFFRAPTAHACRARDARRGRRACARPRARGRTRARFRGRQHSRALVMASSAADVRSAITGLMQVLWVRRWLSLLRVSGLYRTEAGALSSIYANVLTSAMLLLWQPLADLSFEDEPHFPIEHTFHKPARDGPASSRLSLGCRGPSGSKVRLRVPSRTLNC